MLSIITIKDSEKWDQIVKSFKDYDVHYLSGYVKAFQLNGDGEPMLFHFDNGLTRALSVVMKRDIGTDKNFINKIPMNKFFDLITPYGYGGFIIEGNGVSEVLQAYDEYCKSNSIVCEFVRFNLFSGFEKHYNGEVETRTQNIIRSIDMNPCEMLMDFEHKVRKNLKKGNANSLKIEIDSSGHSIEKFLSIYYNTMERNGANSGYYFPKKFFEIITSLKENMVFFNVYHENKIISTELIIYAENNCYSFLGGTIDEYFGMRPNEFLKYEVIKWAYDKGLKNFVLGGGYGSNDGIFKYKKSLAPRGVVNFYVGRKIFINEIYTELVNIRKRDADYIENANFFPVYRGE